MPNLSYAILELNSTGLSHYDNDNEYKLKDWLYAKLVTTQRQTEDTKAYGV